jgi:hypothetical protein
VINGQQVVSVDVPITAFVDSTDYYYFQVLHWDQNNLTYKYVYTNGGSVYPYYKSSGSSNDILMTNAIWSTYDDHPNPLQFIYQQVFPDQYDASANNLTRMVVSDMVGDTLFRYFTHTYNESGLPVKTVETQAKNNSNLNQNIQLQTSTSTYTYEEY